MKVGDIIEVRHYGGSKWRRARIIGFTPKRISVHMLEGPWRPAVSHVKAELTRELEAQAEEKS